MAIENHVYNGDGSVDATINGKHRGGITPESQFWPEVQDAIDADNPPAEYVAPVPTQADLITEALAGTETVAQVARKVEDLIDHIVNGTPLDDSVEAWRADRATKRQNAGN